LNKERRRDLLFDLAVLTSKSSADAIPVGGSFSAKMLCESGIQGNAFEGAVRTFFEDLIIKLNRHWPDYTGKQKYYPAEHFPFEKYGFKATKRNAV
jgi:hypothetical protein